MHTELESRTAIRQLAEKAKEVAETKGLDPARANSQLAKIEKEMTEHRANLDLIAAVKRRMAGSGDALHPGSGFPAAILGGKAPGLTVDLESAEMLFKSAIDRVPISVKAVGTADVDPSAYPQQFLPPVAAARETTRVLDLLPVSPTEAGVVEWYASVGTAAATAVAEGATKPESSISYTRQSATMVKIAHQVIASEESLSDFPSFLALLTQDMTAGVVNAENAELLTSPGTGVHTFKGLLTVSGTQAHTQAGASPGPAETILDAIETGITGLRAGGRYIEPDAVVMTPGDFSKARRLTNTLGNYIAGNPLEAGPATLWGYPVVLTSQLTTGKVVVANFATAAHVWMRAGLSIRTDVYSLSASNQVRVIAEERFALGVVAPGAISVVTLA